MAIAPIYKWLEELKPDDMWTVMAALRLVVVNAESTPLRVALHAEDLIKRLVGAAK